MRLDLKINLLFAVILIVGGIASSLIVNSLMGASLERQLEDKCRLLTHASAELEAVNVIENEVLPVRQALRKVLESDDEIQFAYIVGFDGKIFAHTFEGGFPKALLELLRARKNDRVSHVEKYETEDGPILEVNYPLVEGMRATIHIGMSTSAINDQIAGLNRKIWMLTLFLIGTGVLLGSLVSGRIIRPLKRLAESMRAFGADRVPGEITVRGGGREVEDLVKSFHEMVLDRRKMVEELRETTQLLETVFDTTHVLVAHLDTRFNFIRVNRAYAQADQRDTLFFPGKNHFTLYPNAENETIFQRVLETGVPYFASAKDFQYAEHPERGTTYWDWSLIPTLDAGGGVTGVVLTLADATERTMTVEALRAAMEEVARQNVQLKKLDTIKDGLLRDVSHELKTPVVKQAMQLELLRTQLGATCLSSVEKTLMVMEDSVRRQDSVIHNLLDLSRLEYGGRKFTITDVRLDEVLRKVIDDYRHSLDAHELSLHADLEKMVVRGDEAMLWHVFSNLINNAVKFRNRDRPGNVTVTTSRRGDLAISSIKDDGIGLSREELSKVFERFYQVSPSIEGCGVGLNICQAIIQGMGGRIWLESEGKGAGTMAVVELPLA